MAEQVLSIHGGGEFIGLSPREFLEELKTRDISLDRLRQKTGWKGGELQRALGDAYDVLSPRMPHPDQPHYAEWKIWLERIIPLLNQSVVLVGHSLGGLFLLKYLSEETMPRKIKGLFAVSSPYMKNSERTYKESGFTLSEDFSNIPRQTANLFLYHSTDDVVVPFSDFEKYSRALPGAITRTFIDRGHFNGESFPELVNDIRSL